GVELCYIRIVEIGMVEQIVERPSEFHPPLFAQPELPLHRQVGIPATRSAQNTETGAAERACGVLYKSCCIEPGIHLILPAAAICQTPIANHVGCVATDSPQRVVASRPHR